LDTTAKRNEPKRRGELTELAFLYKATGLGFAVAKPYGDSERFDFVVISGPRLWRVQVKSIGKAAKNGYGVHTCEIYHPRDVDWIVVYVVPEDAWYVVPIEAIGGRQSMYFHPSGSRWGLCRYEKYREAWWQMRPDHRLDPKK
jgi:PD-(D/E)XK endonuclease